MANGDRHAAAFDAIKGLTNERQTAKICDVRQAAALALSWPSNRRAFVRATDDGLWTVAYGSGGGLYLARVLSPSQVVAFANSASVDVVHDRDRLPAAVRRAGDGA